MRGIRRVLGVLACALSTASAAFAQASIAGVIRDTSRAADLRVGALAETIERTPPVGRSAATAEARQRVPRPQRLQPGGVVV